MPQSEKPKFNPWLFVPLLYFMQAIPVTIVQEVSPVFYKDFGIPVELITRWTSLIALPWSLQLLLGPLVDLNGTKRRWILSGQFVIAVGLIAAAMATRSFELSLVILGSVAISSALCNVATDGFYIISMLKEQQAEFVGVQSTCYRLGRLFCTGILVVIEGKLVKAGTDPRTAWLVVLIGGTVLYFLGFLINRKTVPHPDQDQPAVNVDQRENRANLLRTLVLLVLAISGYFFLNSLVRLFAHNLYLAFPKMTGWKLPDRDLVIGVLLDRNPVVVELLQMGSCAAIAAVAFGQSRKLLVGTTMAKAFSTFAQQSGFPAILAFLLFYRFGEAMVSKMSPLFLKDTIANGGLAIANDQLGQIKGVAGIVGIVLGGLVGGVVVAKLGIKKAFLPLAILMHLPNLLYLWAATVHPPTWTLYGVDFVDQFGYGFGYAGYSVYLMWVAQRGDFKTSHYAIGTGLGALFIALAGILSGILQANFGYQGFFVAAMFLTLPGMATLFFIPHEQE